MATQTTALGLVALIVSLVLVALWLRRRRRPAGMPACPDCQTSRVHDYGPKMYPRFACETCGQMFNAS